MRDYQIAWTVILFYCAMIALTHGYVYERNDCYINPPEYGDDCGAEPMAKATIWPLYWVYHSGTLIFEPTNMDR